MRQAVIDHLKTLVQGHRELAEALPTHAFNQELAEPSNTIGAQFWCVIGARESYARAIEGDGWAGFSCSLSGDDVGDKAQVVQGLVESGVTLADTLTEVDEWTDGREGSLLALLEHEAQHQGQLIRYVYALSHRFPQSWVDRWALEQ